MERCITWDNTYEIVQLLSQCHPSVLLQDVSLCDIMKWTIELPEFNDDGEIVTDEILMDIFSVWLEEGLSK